MKRWIKKVVPRVILRAGRRSRVPDEQPLGDASRDVAEGVLRCRIAYNRYGGYCVPLSSQHRPAAQAVLGGGVYEPQTIEYLSARCGSGDIVHAGTYFGDFLPALSKSVADGACVWAFEPNEENYRCALITLAINDLHNVRMTHAALGAEGAAGELITTDAGGRALGGGSRLWTEGPAAVDSLQSVPLLALDDVIPTDRQVSIIHLDVEGYEERALMGALRTIERCRPTLVLETVPERSWLAESILALGYRIGPKLHLNTVLKFE